MDNHVKESYFAKKNHSVQKTVFFRIVELGMLSYYNTLNTVYDEKRTNNF